MGKLSLGPYFAFLVCFSSAANFGLPPFLSFFSELSLFLVLASLGFYWRVVQALVSLLAFSYSIFLCICILGLGTSSSVVGRPTSIFFLFSLCPVCLLRCAGSLFVV